MDAATYMHLEQLVMVSAMGLFLLVVWVAMQLIKSKARYIFELEQLLHRKQVTR